MLSASILLSSIITATSGPAHLTPLPRRWGSDGHEMAARAAASTLPAELPAFFRQAGDQLVYLGPEPDRWRNRNLKEMDGAWSYDHYIDLENVPAAALDAPNRFAFITALHEAGIEHPESDAGFLPYRILEVYERLVTEWRMWRAETDATTKGWIEERIVNDAGILGHYVTDASNPHHTTIHFNGWNKDTPNPNGYTTSSDIHSRFESGFVRAHVSQDDVDERVPADVRSVAGNARAAVMAEIRDSNAQVETLYRLEKEYGFTTADDAAPETVDFVAGRLAVGADMLRTLWWSAWQESASER
jgi:hypothetical protein